MNTILTYLWENRTKVLGYTQGIVAAAMTIDGLIPEGGMKYVLFANAALVILLGHYNSHVLNRTP